MSGKTKKKITKPLRVFEAFAGIGAQHSALKRAIVYAGYQCNIDGNHESFIAKNGKTYMEAHHLIPMSAQDDFENSLDVDANIISLCPVCHRKLHHGIDIDDDLRRLFNSRVELLKQSGIEITLVDLKKYY